MMIDEATARTRHIPKEEFRPCAEAFVDRRNPNSEGKLNYSFIGPGVAQSDTQEVNIGEAHGFNVGGVSLPPGRKNNLHLHFTAEVFISAAGKWEFIWGNDGEGSLEYDRRDVFTIPTWIYRGFYNRGGEDAFMFAVIGEDDPGGIVWNPKVLEDAEKAGVRLSESSMVVDVAAGESPPDGEGFIEPMQESEMARLPTFALEQVEGSVIRWDGLDWRDDALPGGGQLATVLGHGMTASRHHYPKVSRPHSFSIEWLRLAGGERTGSWTSDKTFVAFVFDGSPMVTLNGSDSPVKVQLAERSIYSVPTGTWREFINEGESEAVVLIVHGGDERVRPKWDEATVNGAADRGLAFDPDGFLSPCAALLAK